VTRDPLQWNVFQSGIVATKVSQGHRRAKTSSQNRYLALSGGHRRKTASQVACDLAPMSGRNVCMQTVKTSCRDWLLRSVSNFCYPELQTGDRVLWNQKQ
ncbi:hypothetical protein TNCV_3878101, partial [Trichonephila clavipes]